MSAEPIEVIFEFSGGSEFLVGGKLHTVAMDSGSTLRDAVKKVATSLIQDAARAGMLVSNDGLEPANGVILLLNDCDAALIDGLDSPLLGGDTVTFVSTLHGG